MFEIEINDPLGFGRAGSFLETVMTPDFEDDLDEQDDPEWVAEQRELAGMLSDADLWFDDCIRRSDPCDPAFWADEPDGPDA